MNFYNRSIFLGMHYYIFCWFKVIFEMTMFNIVV
jgi:hypothetical protein